MKAKEAGERRQGKRDSWTVLLGAWFVLCVSGCAFELSFRLGSPRPAEANGPVSRSEDVRDDSQQSLDHPSDPHTELPTLVGIEMRGLVKDYFTGDALANAELVTEGIRPTIRATSSGTGEYELRDVPPNGVFYVRASRGEAYLETKSDLRAGVDSPAVRDLFVVSGGDAQRFHATAGIEMHPLTSVVIADVRRPNGQPLEGVPREDFALVDRVGAPAAGEPYFLGPTGGIDLTLPTSTSFGGRSRAVFLNVPAGTFTVTARALDEQGQPTLSQALVSTSQGGVTLVTVGLTDDAVDHADLGFDPRVYRILQRASLGGMGCANCHTQGGIAEYLSFDAPVGDVYDVLLSRPDVVNLLSPVESLLLTKPLFEDPPNHPSATWLTGEDAGYRMVLAWIAQGAKP